MLHNSGVVMSNFDSFLKFNFLCLCQWPLSSTLAVAFDCFPYYQPIFYRAIKLIIMTSCGFHAILAFLFLQDKVPSTMLWEFTNSFKSHTVFFSEENCSLHFLFYTHTLPNTHTHTDFFSFFTLTFRLKLHHTSFFLFSSFLLFSFFNLEFYGTIM